MLVCPLPLSLLPSPPHLTVARIAERYKLMNERYHTACELYNENADQIEPFEFFSYFATFCNNFKV